VVLVGVLLVVGLWVVVGGLVLGWVATEIWTASGSGAYSDAAIPALILVVIASLPTLLFRTDQRDASTPADEPAPRSPAADPTPG
jgi:ABC-type Fe3+ transport system permease subunit